MIRSTILVFNFNIIVMFWGVMYCFILFVTSLLFYIALCTIQYRDLFLCTDETTLSKENLINVF